MNVLLLHSFADSEQSINQVVSLGAELSKQGLYPYLLLLNQEKENSQKYKELLTDLRYDVAVANDKKEITPLFLKFKFDLIHAHSFLAFNLAQELSSFYELPYVLTVQKRDINVKLPEAPLQGAKAIIYLESEIGGSLTGYQEKLHIISESIDTDRYSPFKKGNPVKIFYNGKVDQYNRKGFLALGKALVLLDSAALNFEFYYSSNLESNYTAGKPLRKHHSLVSHLRETDIVLGGGRVILEGMAAGNAALVLGQIYGGMINRESVARSEHFDYHGLSGKESCYKNIFFDLARLIKNRRYLKEVQNFSRNYIIDKYNIKNTTAAVIKTYL